MFHGGDLHQASRQYGVPLEAWLDLSTGVNPIPYPVGTIDQQDWHRLPSPTSLSKLEALARHYYRVNDDAEILATSGSSALIAALPSLKTKANCSLILQSYQEHLKAWQHAGAHITLVQEQAPAFNKISKDLKVTNDCNVCILVNPNNPTGRLYKPETLLTLHERLGPNGLLIVDEAFMDCTPEQSLTPFAGKKGLIILRSFGKFFGLAGLRLGFAIGHPDDIQTLRIRLGSWPLSGAAISIARKAFTDTDWIHQTRTRLQSDKNKLNTLLLKQNIEIIGGTDLFTLIRNDNIQNLQSKLAKHAIWTRIFDYEPDWMRIGVPSHFEAFNTLKNTLLL